MGLGISLLTFAIAVAFLLLAAKFFTRSAEDIGYRLGMTPFAIGVVIVSVGTSLPELVSAIAAVRAGDSEIVAGNVIGSSLSNILFVLGLTALLSPKRIDLGSQYIYIDLNYLVGAALIAAIAMYDGVVHQAEATIGLLAYGVYLYYLLNTGNNQIDEDAEGSVIRGAKATWVKPLLILLVSGVAIYFSATKTIQSLSEIAGTLGVSKAIISITLLSMGTTLPECVVSVTAARLGKAEIAVGNVLGSCIFNALAIPGIAAFFGALKVPTEIIVFALPVYAAIVLLFYLLTQDKKISAFEGALLLLLYCLVMGKICKLV
jgi:cation:H+ antiporter